MITRFAPSPTGPLHLGHAYSAIYGHDLARAAGGKFLLRIEDIDTARSRAEWEDLIYEDLTWLGITWDGPVMRQSERISDYESALTSLSKQGLLYPCICSRKDIANALSAPQEGVNVGFDGPRYPGTCKGKSITNTVQSALRINMKKAVEAIDKIEWIEVEEGKEAKCSMPADRLDEIHGDIVLARKDIGTSYHISVVVDDAAQRISDVVRGRDLSDATAIHVLLQRLLGLPTPRYHHHRLIRDGDGRRLAKRDNARAIRTYRAEGKSPGDIRALLEMDFR